MKRTAMRNAPVLPKSSEQPPAPAHKQASPASPVVGDLTRRLQGMKGNTITLSVCGRDVVFTLETVAASMVEKATMVWAGNERDQSLLTQAALDDLIPSFLSSGQQNPAFGRKISGIIEVADGSRRRQTAIYTSSDYYVLVGELDDEQMAHLSQIGNDYRPTSAYERGKRYARRLTNEFGGNVSHLAEAEGIERKVIGRCIRTASLPHEIIALFKNPGELSARAGESLAKAYQEHEDAIFSFAQHLARRLKSGEAMDAKAILEQLHSMAEKPGKIAPRERTFGSGLKAKYRGDAVSFQLNNVPPALAQQIENLLEQHQLQQQNAIKDMVNGSFDEIDTVVAVIKTAAIAIEYNISQNEILSTVPFARSVMKDTASEAERLKRISDEIAKRYVL